MPDKENRCFIIIRIERWKEESKKKEKKEKHGNELKLIAIDEVAVR